MDNEEFWRRLTFHGLDTGAWASSSSGWTDLAARRKTGKRDIETVELPSMEDE